MRGRHDYFLNRAARERLTVPVMPFSAIEDFGAGMYLGQRRASAASSDAPAIHAGEGGAAPTLTLHTPGERKNMRHDWKPIFVEALRNSGNVRAACQSASITRSNAYKARLIDPRFRASWDDAIEDAIDTLEAVAWQRARTGLSDQVLMMLLRSHRPQLYRERVHIEVTREQDIAVVMKARGVTRDEAESAIAEAERLTSAG